MPMDLRETGRILERHGIQLKKSLGQNFLVDPSVPRRTAEAAAPEPGFGVLEIGPGAGALTASLAERAEKVVAVELDPRMLPVLSETLADFRNVEIIEGDALKLDIAETVRSRLGGLHLAAAANLPYYVTTPLVERLLETRLFERVCVMVQREVARRMVADAGSDDYGAFSVYCRYYAEPKILFGVSAGCFLPPPKVESAVVLFECRSAPPKGIESAEEERDFFRLTRAAFSERRKKLSGLAAREFGVSKETVERELEEMGLRPDVRGERLSLEEFISLEKRLTGR